MCTCLILPMRPNGGRVQETSDWVKLKLYRCRGRRWQRNRAAQRLGRFLSSDERSNDFGNERRQMIDQAQMADAGKDSHDGSRDQRRRVPAVSDRYELVILAVGHDHRALRRRRIDAGPGLPHSQSSKLVDSSSELSRAVVSRSSRRFVHTCSGCNWHR